MIITGKVSKSQLAAIDFFADALLTKQLKKHIIIHVKFRKTMNCLGLTGVEDYNSSGKPREFIVEINRDQSQEEIIKTIAHEMIHVRQYAMGQLNEQGTQWCGKKLKRELEYHKQPWEIEAHDVSDILYEEYKEKMNGRTP